MRLPSTPTLALAIALVLALAACGPATTLGPATEPSGLRDASGLATIGTAADDGARIVHVDVLDERTRDLTIDSPAAGTVMVRLLLPASFEVEPEATYPTLYLIHGGAGEYSDWTEKTDVEAHTAWADLLVVMPAAGTSFLGDGNTQGAGSGGRAEWEPFHAVELPQLMERNWRAGDARAVAGLSLGGYEAVYLAGRHPGLFRAAASYSGALGIDDLIEPLTARLDDNQRAALREFKALTDEMGLVNLNDIVPGLRELRALFISYGDGTPGPLTPAGVTAGDPLKMLCGEGSEIFAQLLEENGVPVTVSAYGAGTHAWSYWDREFQVSLPLLLEALGQPSEP